MAEPVSEQLLRALAHPLRLGLLVELEERGERSPAELATALHADRAIVDEHLAILRGAGLIADDVVPGRVTTTGHGWVEIAQHLRSLQP
ncbi:MAG TPA: ArsR family transcriptional regulator [Baekduia sp.]